MEEVATQMSHLSQYFPGDTEPIKFLEIGRYCIIFFIHWIFFLIYFLDGDRETIGSESVVSFDTAEQSLVSQSEVGAEVTSELTGVTRELAVSEDNPESLALAVKAANNTNNPLSAWFTNQFDHHHLDSPCLFLW